MSSGKALVVPSESVLPSELGGLVSSVSGELSGLGGLVSLPGEPSVPSPLDLSSVVGFLVFSSEPSESGFLVEPVDFPSPPKGALSVVLVIPTFKASESILASVVASTLSTSCVTNGASVALGCSENRCNNA